MRNKSGVKPPLILLVSRAFFFLLKINGVVRDSGHTPLSCPEIKNAESRIYTSHVRFCGMVVSYCEYFAFYFTFTFQLCFAIRDGFFEIEIRIGFNVLFRNSRVSAERSR